MNHILRTGSLVLLAAGLACANDQARGGVPKQEPIPKGGARLVNPAAVAARLYRMSPEEREHALEKLPNEQARERARRELAWFDSLPKEAQEIQLRRLDRSALLPPEKRAEVRGLIAEVNALPPKRSAAVRTALYQLQKMTDPQREATLQRPAFQARFSPEELRVIKGLADAWMGPVE